MARLRCGESLRSNIAPRIPSGLIQPIEATRFFHFHPGSKVLIPDLFKTQPNEIPKIARGQGIDQLLIKESDLIHLLKTDPDFQDTCHAKGVGILTSSLGNLALDTRRNCLKDLRAVRIDLQGFTDAFYVQKTGFQLRAVLETLLHLYHETDCWLEITISLILGVNDHPIEIDAMTKWLVKHLGHDVPVHFKVTGSTGAFVEEGELLASRLMRAQKKARSNGLSHVYIDLPGFAGADHTGCEYCGGTLIVRQDGMLVRNALVAGNSCPSCGMKLQGQFFNVPDDENRIILNSRGNETAFSSRNVAYSTEGGFVPFR